MKHAFSLAAVLLVLWLLLSGLYYPLFLLFGLASMALVVWIVLRMDVADREGHPIHMSLRALKYWPWLFGQIAKSNLDVAARILRGRGSITPSTFTVRASQRSTVGRTTYANSITLTPGTVSMSLDDEEIQVHALTEASRDGVLAGEMDRRVTIFEGESRREGAAPTADD